MILIIGAEASGKREFAKNLGYTEDDFTTDPFDGKRVVYGVQSILFADHTRTQELYDALVDKDVVICNEVGSGVIPVERNVRLGREAAGRLCVLLAKDAETVVRMVCGIPTIIKGQI